MDSRFHVTVKFEIYGQEFNWKASLNWSGYDGYVDPRIAEWFCDCHNQAYTKHLADVETQYVALRETEERERELSELLRLAQKYPEAIKRSQND